MVKVKSRAAVRKSHAAVKKSHAAVEKSHAAVEESHAADVKKITFLRKWIKETGKQFQAQSNNSQEK